MTKHSDKDMPVIPGSMIHREHGQPSQCHICGYEGIPLSGKERDLCPICQRDVLYEAPKPIVPGLAPIRKADEPSKNAPCPCGSGKKYKKCHGAK